MRWKIGGQRLLLLGRDAVDAHADDRSLVDLAEVEAERCRVAERRGRPEQVLVLRDPDHQVVGVEVLLVLGLAVGVEVGRVDQVVAGRQVANGQRQVARRAALGRAEADQQLQVVRVLPQDVRDRVDVGGFRAALGAEVGIRHRCGERNRRREATDHPGDRPGCAPNHDRRSAARGEAPAGSRAGAGTSAFTTPPRAASRPPPAAVRGSARSPRAR